jgi:hypothetical protein
MVYHTTYIIRLAQLLAAELSDDGGLTDLKFRYSPE